MKGDVIMIKLRKNLWAGILSVILGCGLWILIPLQIRSKVVSNTAAVGPDFFPRLTAILLMLLGAGLIIQAIVKKDREMVVFSWEEEKRTLLILLLFLAYILLLPVITYVVATPLFACGCLFLMGDRSLRHYIVVLVLTACVYALFRFVLHVSLP